MSAVQHSYFLADRRAPRLSLRRSLLSGTLNEHVSPCVLGDVCTVRVPGGDRDYAGQFIVKSLLIV